MAKKKPSPSNTNTPAGNVLPKVTIGRGLDTVDGWRREVSRIYKDMRMGVIPSSEGTRLTYVARVAADLVKMQEELKELENLRAQLQRLGVVDSSRLLDHEASSPTLQAVDDLQPEDNVVPLVGVSSTHVSSHRKSRRIASRETLAGLRFASVSLDARNSCGINRALDACSRCVTTCCRLRIVAV